MRKIVVAIAATLLMMACTSIDCPVENTVYTAYQLQKADGTADTLKIDTLWVWAHRTNRKDTLLINRLCGSNATTFSLPLSHVKAEDSLFTRMKDTIGTVWLDTLCIRKENYPHFESVDCKAVYFHKITGATSTHHIIDTLITNHVDVNYDATKAHFHLRLKARR